MPIVDVRRSQRHGHERGQRRTGSYTDGRFDVTEDDASPWSVGDKLLMVFAAFIAVVFSVSALALLVISIRAFFQ
jgi:hypothetical protein